MDISLSISIDSPSSPLAEQEALGVVVASREVLIFDWGSETVDEVEITVEAPADYAGTYTIDMTALAAAPQLLRAAPAPTGTQALGETLTGRPALWAIADGETIDIERRWWKGNGPLLDQGGYAPLGLTYDCEWHSDAQEPFRIDERARYVADPEAAWSAWQEGDETTPPDPSPFLSGSFVDPATRELWACTPYTTQHGLLKRDLTTPAVRALDRPARFENINPHGAALPYYETELDVDFNSTEMQIRNNAMWFFGGRSPNMFLTSPTVDWLNRTEMTSIQAYMFTLPTPWPVSEVILTNTDSGNSIRVRPVDDRLQGMVTTGAGQTLARDDDWFTNYYGTPSPISPTIVVVGMRRKDDITSVWTNGSVVAAGPAENAGTFTTADETSMAGFTNNASHPENVNALVGTTFFAAYGLSDAEMTAVMNHIARAVGVPT
jgi:hypothetical protein